jgi:hypothetical protein
MVAPVAIDGTTSPLGRRDKTPSTTIGVVCRPVSSLAGATADT